MTRLAVSLRFVRVPALAQLLAELGSTGRMRILAETWSGEIVFRGGQMVSATLGNESGRAAVEGISIGLLDGEVYFEDELVAVDDKPLVDPTELRGYLMRLAAVGERIAELIPSLKTIPTMADGAERQQNSPALGHLVSGRTLDQVAQERGLGRTVRELAPLVEAGIVKLEPQPTTSAHAAAPAHAARPLWPARPTRSAPAQKSTGRATPRTRPHRISQTAS